MYRWLTTYLELKREYDFLCLDVVEDDTQKEVIAEKLKKIEQFVETFEDLDSLLLAEHYIHGHKLADVADSLGYSYQYIKNKHAELVKMIQFRDEIKEASLKDKKVFLSRYREMCKVLENMEVLYEEQKYSGVTNGAKDTEERIKAYKDSLAAVRQEVQMMIDTVVKPSEWNVLCVYYLEGFTDLEGAGQLGISEKHFHRLKKDGVENAKMPSEVRA